VLRGVVLAVVWTVAAITVLDQAGVQVAPILAAAGIAGIALGFGAQSLVKDILAGFFILMENQYDVGDVIAIAGVSGTVEAVNMRTTVLRSLDGSRHVVPNGEITVSSNMTKVYSRYLFVLPVPYEEDVDRPIAVLEEVAEELSQDPEFGPLMTGTVTVLGVDQYGDSSVDVKCYVETVPGEQWKVGRELRRRLKMALDERGIEIPYPRRELIIRKVTEPDEEP
jgi:small-conductance mechanosensitive channel